MCAEQSDRARLVKRASPRFQARSLARNRDGVSKLSKTIYITGAPPHGARWIARWNWRFALRIAHGHTWPQEHHCSAACGHWSGHITTPEATSPLQWPHENHCRALAITADPPRGTASEGQNSSKHDQIVVVGTATLRRQQRSSTRSGSGCDCCETVNGVLRMGVC